MHALVTPQEATAIIASFGGEVSAEELAETVALANKYANKVIGETSLNDPIWCQQMPVSAATKLRCPRETIAHWHAETARVQIAEDRQAAFNQGRLY